MKVEVIRIVHIGPGPECKQVGPVTYQFGVVPRVGEVVVIDSSCFRVVEVIHPATREELGIASPIIQVT